ncbi:MAG: hypothetical protein ACRD0M_11695, partial [Acidimicrobiales bacterium]
MADARRELLVLAAGPGGCAAVDLASGALVRAHYPARTQPDLVPYDVLAAQPGGDDTAAFAPDSLVLATVPERVGHLRGRAVERWLRPLVYPPTEPLLGFSAPSVPFWALADDRPSLALVAPSAGPVVERGRAG